MSKYSKQEITEYRNRRKQLRLLSEKTDKIVEEANNWVERYHQLQQNLIDKKALDKCDSVFRLIESNSASKNVSSCRTIINEKYGEYDEIDNLTASIINAARQLSELGEQDKSNMILVEIGNAVSLNNEISVQEENDRNIAKYLRNKFIAIFASALLIASCIAFTLISFMIYPNSMINKIENAISNEQYDLAFSSLEKYSEYFEKSKERYGNIPFASFKSNDEVAELRNNINYKKACKLLEDKEFDEAYNTFLSLGAYKDAIIMGTETLYRKACLLQSDLRYIDAIEVFSNIKEYQDSENKIEKCKENLYNQGLELYDTKKYDDSNVIFKYLGNYKDSAFLIHRHKWKDDHIKTKPTCSEPGVMILLCECEKEKEEKIEPLGHDYKSQVTIKAECISTGEKTFTCKRCGNSYTEPIKALGHDYSSKITKKASCNIAGVKTYTCKHCGDSYTKPIKALEHKYKSKTTKKATCQEEGVKTYTCEHCGGSYTKSIPKKEHDFTKADCTHDSHCKVCGLVKTPALGHTTSTGVCTRCGYNFSKPVVFSYKYYASADNISKNYDIDLPDGKYKLTLKVSAIEEYNPVFPEHDFMNRPAYISVHISSGNGLGDSIDPFSLIIRAPKTFTSIEYLRGSKSMYVYSDKVEEYKIIIEPAN